MCFNYLFNNCENYISFTHKTNGKNIKNKNYSFLINKNLLLLNHAHKILKIFWTFLSV